MRLRTKIATFFLVVSLSGMYLLGFVAYELMQNHVIASKVEELRAIVNTNQIGLRHVAAAWKDRVNLLTSRTRLRAALIDYIDESEDTLLDEINLILSDGFKMMRNARQITLCDLDGNMITQTAIDSVAATRCTVKPARQSDSPSLDEFWTDPVDQRQYVIFTGTLAYNGVVIAFARVAFDTVEFTESTQSYTGLGNTGEVLVAVRAADGSARYLTPLQSSADGGSLSEVPMGHPNIPMTAALMNREVTFIDKQTIDYSGEPVFAVSGYVPEYGWGLVAKIDRSEALTPVYALIRTVLYALLTLSALMIVTGLYFGHLIAGPIAQLNSVVRRVAQGDLAHSVDVMSRDEIGDLAGSFNDMTRALRIRTAEIEDARERINAVVETTVDGIITVDESGTIETFNKACEHLFGYEAKEVIGENVKLLMPEPHRSAHDGYLARYQRTGGGGVIGFGRELEGQHKNGSVFAMELAVSAVNLKDRRLICGIVRDISERIAATRRLDEAMTRLRESNDDLERFAHAASHDLKAPLHALGSLVSVLEDDLGESVDEECLTLMQQMRARLRRMQTLVDDLLTYAKLDSGAACEEVIRASEIVFDVVELLDVPEQMRVETGAELDALFVQRVPLTQVFHNLMGNAVKHHDRRSGSIKVHGIDTGKFVEFTVSDDGPGIPTGDRERVFDMFMKLQSNDIVEGSGMGLSIVKKLVERYGGTISISAEKPRGTTFRFTWPAACHDTAEHQDAA